MFSDKPSKDADFVVYIVIYIDSAIVYETEYKK